MCPQSDQREADQGNMCRTPPHVETDGVIKMQSRGFAAGAVVQNPPANAGDTGLSPGPGRSHMLWSN